MRAGADTHSVQFAACLCANAALCRAYASLESNLACQGAKPFILCMNEGPCVVLQACGLATASSTPTEPGA